MDKPIVSHGDKIWVGNIRAVVCQVFKDGNIEVVYYSGDDPRAINNGATWLNDHWEFIHSMGGGYADNNSRLANCVSILRQGRQRYE